MHLTNNYQRITKFNGEAESGGEAFRKKEQMTTEEILKALAHKDSKFPREALEQAIARKDEITPHLLRILEKVADDPVEILDQKDFSYLYALHLLAQFGETRAYPLVVRIASYPPGPVDELLGDTITEGLPKILASVSGGDTSLIKQLAENPKAEKFVRGSALRALTALVASGDVSREEVMSYYSGLFDAKLKEGPSDETEIVLTNLTSCATDLYPEELYGKIKEAFENDLIDKFMIGLRFVDEKMALGKEAVLAELREDRHLQLLNDTIEEMEWWAWYHESDEKAKIREAKQKELEHNQQLLRALFDSESDSTPLTSYVAPEKIGRNDPCLCSSGKKYKKCCGA